MKLEKKNHTIQVHVLQCMFIVKKMVWELEFCFSLQFTVLLICSLKILSAPNSIFIWTFNKLFIQYILNIEDDLRFSQKLIPIKVVFHLMKTWLGFCIPLKYRSDTPKKKTTWWFPSKICMSVSKIIFKICIIHLVGVSFQNPSQVFIRWKLTTWKFTLNVTFFVFAKSKEIQHD
jgi:hypothetical protein